MTHPRLTPLERLMAAITFAEAGEVETALALRDGQYPLTPTTAPDTTPPHPDHRPPR